MEKALSISGTGYKDEVKVTYADLVKTFGEPHTGASADGKVQAGWAFELDDAIITIYDYKEWGVPVTKVTNWHVGGKGWPTKEFGIEALMCEFDEVGVTYKF